MSAVRFSTNLDQEAAHAAAVQAAKSLGFGLAPRKACQFLASRGSLLRSILLPPTRPYCRFLVTVMPECQRAANVILEKNDPWWMGGAAQQMISELFDELVDAIAEAIEATGGSLLQYFEV
jgi:hypothetical protein